MATSKAQAFGQVDAQNAVLEAEFRDRIEGAIKRARPGQGFPVFAPPGIPAEIEAAVIAEYTAPGMGWTATLNKSVPQDGPFWEFS